VTARLTGRPGFVLAICVVAHTFLSIDRGLMAILQEAIKRDLLLTDSQLGLLSGLGFALFFGIAGLPIGFLVDRYCRRDILAAAVFVFSGMTALGAATSSFAQLLVTRSVVGAGEAGGGPSMGSMLADLYPPTKRSSALSIYYLGAPLGSIIAFLVGGWVAAHYGWRAVLLFAGLPGVALAILIRLLVAEPERRRDTGGGAPATPPFRATVGFIWSQRSLRHVLFTPVLTSAASTGILIFAGSYFVRLHGLGLARVGVLMAIFYGAAGAVGAVAGGHFVDRLVARDPRWAAWWCGGANLLAAPAAALMTLSTGLEGAVAGMALLALCINSTYGALLALVQSLVAATMRGTLIAIFYLANYLLGAAAGPQLVGGISDLLTPHVGIESLRWAMLSMTLLYVWGAAHFLLGSRTLQQDAVRAAAI
jgi:MFS family permease